MEAKNALIENSNNKEESEEIMIGFIVSNLAHPYTLNNTSILITNYARLTPPLMVVVEKNYGAKFSATTGASEDNDSYRCLYFSTTSGSFEYNWFKKREIKLIFKAQSNFINETEENTVENLKKRFLGKMAILTSVDLEMGKKKIWSDSDAEISKFKMNNLLDYLPPFGSVIDIKLNDDPQKYNEKNGKVIHKKSKALAKLRWLNNNTSKYSEEYIPIIALKSVEINLKNYSSTLHYLYESPVELENNDSVKILKSPVRFKDAIWKHYYYSYRFIDLFTHKVLDMKDSETVKITGPDDLSSLLDKTVFLHGSSSYFNKITEDNFLKKWYEIKYSDKNDRYTKRIIYINEFQEEQKEDGSVVKILKANCLLRNGQIRHFRISRIRGYRKLTEDFEKTFVK